jgi:BirA family biotin operon repressor/biotin-[acetyl-CoA-carboxylase] ligase
MFSICSLTLFVTVYCIKMNINFNKHYKLKVVQAIGVLIIYNFAKSEYMNHNWPIIELNSVDSTNNYANMLLAKNEVDREMVVTANCQTKGRGQHENVWMSDEGVNVLLSLVLFTNYLKVNQQFYLSIAVSLGIADFLNSKSIDAQVKWPNDIYVGSCKIAGILIEHSVMGQNLMHSVVGIGLNLNQIYESTEHFKATSVKQILGVGSDLKDSTNVLLFFINKRIAELKRLKLHELMAEYYLKLYKFKVASHFSSDFGEFYGTIEKVLPTGELVIMAGNGIEHTFLFKEVKFID